MESTNRRKDEQVFKVETIGFELLIVKQYDNKNMILIFTARSKYHFHTKKVETETSSIYNLFSKINLAFEEKSVINLINEKAPSEI